MFESGEKLEVRRSHKMMLTLSDIEDLEEEVYQAIENNAEKIDEGNCDKIFTYRVTKNKVKWFINCCTHCTRPFMIHENPWIEECSLDPIKQDLKGEYIHLLENNARIKQIARDMEPDP